MLDYGYSDYGFALRLQYAGLRLWRLWFSIKTAICRITAVASVVLHENCNMLDYGCGDYGFALRLQYAGLRLWPL